MKSRFGNKEARSVSIIGENDEPTSVFILRRSNSKPSLKQNIQKFFYNVRQRRIIKSLRENAHSMEQVADYMVTELGFTEVKTSEPEYKREYLQMRTSFMMQYQPELLGDLQEDFKLEKHEEENIKLFLDQMEQRQKAAQDIPLDIFDIDLHIYELNDEKTQSKIIIEKKYGYIGGSASGLKNNSMKKFDKIFRKVYQYYGVTQEDIDNKTKRYIELVKTLSRR